MVMRLLNMEVSFLNECVNTYQKKYSTQHFFYTIIKGFQRNLSRERQSTLGITYVQF